MTDDMSDELAYLESAKEQVCIIQFRPAENSSWKDITAKNLAKFYYKDKRFFCCSQYRAIPADSSPINKTKIKEKNKMIDLNSLCKTAFENAKARQKNGSNVNVYTPNMLKHCATEVIEAMEAYTNSMIRYGSINQQFADKLADIICCVLIIAGREEIDIEKAVNVCIEKNRKRAEGTWDKL